MIEIARTEGQVRSIRYDGTPSGAAEALEVAAAIIRHEGCRLQNIWLGKPSLGSDFVVMVTFPGTAGDQALLPVPDDTPAPLVERVTALV